MTRLLGLRNICHTKEDWYYLIFYDIDRPITQSEQDAIEYFSNRSHIPYLLYSTKHGTHYIGLRPLISTDWSIMFEALKTTFHSYYSGQTIRISRKQNEEQNLIRKNTMYNTDDILPNLYNLYAKRFNYEPMYWSKEPLIYEQKTGKKWYGLVFEKYRSMNE